MLSSFRSRDPEEGGGPGGQGVGGGQEEEEEEEEDEVRPEWWEVGEVYISDTLHLSLVSLCPFISSSQPQLFPRLLLGVCLSPRCGESRSFCGSPWQCDSGPARRNLPCSCQSVWLSVLRVSGSPCFGLIVPASLGTVFGSLSPSLFLFGGEGFVSTVTGFTDSGIGEGTLRFRDPSPSPAGQRVEAGSPGSWTLEGRSRPSGGITCFPPGLMVVARSRIWGPRRGQKLDSGP